MLILFYGVPSIFNMPKIPKPILSTRVLIKTLNELPNPKFWNGGLYTTPNETSWHSNSVRINHLLHSKIACIQLGVTSLTRPNIKYSASWTNTLVSIVSHCQSQWRHHARYVHFGTRPEAIKMAPVVHALSDAPNIDSIVCVTEQHRDMLDQVLTLFDVVPDEDLNNATQSISAYIDGRMIDGLHLCSTSINLMRYWFTTIPPLVLQAPSQRLRPYPCWARGSRSPHDLTAPFPEKLNNSAVALANGALPTAVC